MVRLTLARAVQHGGRVRLPGDEIDVDEARVTHFANNGLVFEYLDDVTFGIDADGQVEYARAGAASDFDPLSNGDQLLTGGKAITEGSDVPELGLDDDVVDILIIGGYPSVASLSGVTEKELQKLKGIGAVRASEIVDAVKAHGS